MPHGCHLAGLPWLCWVTRDPEETAGPRGTAMPAKGWCRVSQVTGKCSNISWWKIIHLTRAWALKTQVKYVLKHLGQTIKIPQFICIHGGQIPWKWTVTCKASHFPAIRDWPAPHRARDEKQMLASQRSGSNEKCLHPLLPGDLKIHVFIRNLTCLQCFWVKERSLDHNVIYLLWILSLGPATAIDT